MQSSVIGKNGVPDITQCAAEHQVPRPTIELETRNPTTQVTMFAWELPLGSSSCLRPNVVTWLDIDIS
jgi:hypothetical protein